jgi:phage-related baseplate assembly protein
LTLPDVVQTLSYDEILEQNLDIVKSLLPDYKPAEGDNVMLVLRVFSYRELNLRALFNSLAKAFFLSTASGSDLDNLAETLYGLYRLPGAKPYANMEFSLTAILPYDMLIPTGFELVDETGIHFAKLLNDVVIKAGETSAVGTIELQEYVASSSVKTEIQVSPLPYLQVKQLTPFANGSNPESDEDFKERIRLSFANKSTAGSTMTYKAFTFQADERVEDVRVLSPNAGIVDVVYYSSVADDLMQERIENTLNADEVRPLTDLVQVKKANEITFDVEGEIVIESGVDASSVYVEAINSLKTLTFNIGEDVSLAKIIYFLMVDGVIDVNLTNPTANIEIDDYSIAILNNVNLTYKVLDEL